MKKRLFIIIDGSNLYNRLKEKPLSFKNLLKFDFARFINYLSKDKKLVKSCYYVGAIRTEKNNPKSFQLYQNQRKLIGILRKNHIDVSLGYILKANNYYHEKGVDVQIAVDLLIGAYEDLWDAAILVSSDTDLLPAIKKVRELGKTIGYVGFSHNPSFALIRFSDSRTLLKKEDIELFFKKP